MVVYNGAKKAIMTEMVFQKEKKRRRGGELVKITRYKNIKYNFCK